MNDVLDRNLRALLRRSYVPALPAPHYRDRLESLFLAEVERRTARIPRARRLRSVRLALAAAAAFLALFLGWRLFAPAAPATRDALLARGAVALGLPDGSWRAADEEERFHGVVFAPPTLVAATPDGAELDLLVRAGRVHLFELSEVELRRAGAEDFATLVRGSAWFQAGAERIALDRAIELPLRAPPPIVVGPAAAGGRGRTAERESVLPGEPAPSVREAFPPRALAGLVVEAATGDPIDSFTVGLLRERTGNETYPPTIREFDAADGAFRWEDPPAGKQRVFVHAPDFALLLLGEFDFPGELPVLRAELEPGETVRGSVFDGEGNPVPDALVLSEMAVPTDGLFLDDVRSFWLPIRARTGPDGRFELAHLAAGTHVLRAWAPGFAPGWLHGVRVPAAPGDELVLRLGRGGTIAGRVTREDGGPWAGAELVAVVMDQTERRPTNLALAETDADGRYRIEHVPATLMIVALMQGERPDVRPVTVREGEVAVADFAARPRGARVHGRVLDERGEPLTGRNVGLFDRKEANWDRNWTGTTTDADGRYEFLGVAPGAYELFLIEDMGRELCCVDRFDVGEPEVEHDVRLPSGRLVLRVRAAETGEPVPGAFVFLTREEEPAALAALATCDEGGELLLGGLLPGTYLAHVYPTRPGLAFAASEPLVVDPALPAPEAEVRLEAGGCATVLVRAANGRPLEHAVVVFVDEHGAEHSFARLPFTDAEGRLEACGLRPGRYVVHVQLDGHQGTPVSFRLDPGFAPEVPVVLSPVPPR